jgi:nucleotide-binding universal stress UspA family protein
MKILICNDGSEQADRALGLGSTIAAGCGAEVTVLGIVEAAAESEKVAASLNRGLSILQDKKVKAELITRTGKPLAEIVRRTQEVNYDLILIGAVRKQRHGAFWMSSKSYKIIKEVKPPVMAVAGNTSSLKRILICSGGKPYIENAIQLTGEIAGGVGAEVSILHVMPEAPAIYAHLPRMHEGVETLLQSHSELGANLRHAQELLQARQVTAKVLLRQGPVLEEVLHEICERNYDLVVTGSALHRSLSTYVLGDVTREIVNHASCPVLVVRSLVKPWRSHFSLRSLLGRTDLF